MEKLIDSSAKIFKLKRQVFLFEENIKPQLKRVYYFAPKNDSDRKLMDKLANNK